LNNDWGGFVADFHALTPSPSPAQQARETISSDWNAPLPPQWERGWGEGTQAIIHGRSKVEGI